MFFFFFQAEDGIRDYKVTGVQTCALPIWVKESNRLELVAANLRAVGVEAEARGNDLHVRGTERPPRGRVDTARDHRLAMAFAVLGALPGAEVELSERKSVAISYPAFFADLRRIGSNARHRG